MKQMPATISITPATCFSLNAFFLRMLSVMKVTATVRAFAVMELNCQGYLPRRKPYNTEPTLLRPKKSKNFHLFKIFHKLFKLKSMGSNYFSSVWVYFSMKGLVPPQNRLTTKKGRMSQKVSDSNISQFNYIGKVNQRHLSNQK